MEGWGASRVGRGWNFQFSTSPAPKIETVNSWGVHIVRTLISDPRISMATKAKATVMMVVMAIVTVTAVVLGGGLLWRRLTDDATYIREFGTFERNETTGLLDYVPADLNVNHTQEYKEGCFASTRNTTHIYRLVVNTTYDALTKFNQAVTDIIGNCGAVMIQCPAWKSWRQIIHGDVSDLYCKNWTPDTVDQTMAKCADRYMYNNYSWNSSGLPGWAMALIIVACVVVTCVCACCCVWLQRKGDLTSYRSIT